MKACIDGKPRGLLAHVDHGKARKSAQPHLHKSSLQDVGRGLVSPKRDHTIRTPDTAASKNRKDQRNSVSMLVGTDKTNDLLLGSGRYASNKKIRSKDVRPVSLVDVQHRRDVETLQKKLYQ